MLSAKVDSMVLDGMQAVILAGGLGSRLSEEMILVAYGRNWRQAYSLAYFENL